MRWHTHAAASANAVWLFTILPVGIVHPVFLVIAAAFGGLLPDIDASDAKIKHLGWKGINPLAPLSFIFNAVFGHRGILHSFLALGALMIGGFLLLIWLPWQILLAVWLGYLIHLLLDAITPSGVPFFYPLDRRIRVLPRPLSIPTGSIVEELVFAIFAMLLAVYIFMNLFR